MSETPPSAEEIDAAIKRTVAMFPTAAEAGENLRRFAHAFNSKYPGGLIDAWGLQIAEQLRQARP